MTAYSDNHATAAVSIAPVRLDSRLVSLDVIRGLSVLMILIANVSGFGQPDLAYYWPPALPGGASDSDGLVWLAQFVIVDGKFRGLFTVLFGASMLLFLDKFESEARGTIMQIRRLFWLLLFGLAHFFLLFRGDILFSYAVAGTVALLFVRMSGDRLLALGLIWAAIGGILSSLDYLTPALIEAGSEPAVEAAISYYREYWAEQQLEAELQQALIGNGTYWNILSYHWQSSPGLLASYVIYCFFETIPLVLMGMGLFRLGVFAAPEEGATWHRLAMVGVAISLLLNLAMGIHVMQDGFPPYQTQLVFFGLTGVTNLPFLLGAPVLLAHWAWTARESWLAERLSLAGRMAFSNYIGTSLVMVLVFQGWAGGLFAQMHRVEMLAAVGLGWALMITGSRLWLARFRQGPLEWLWRCLSYQALFPNRLPIEKRSKLAS